MLEYEVYFPEDFPQEDYGITTVDIDFSVESPDGGGIEANGVAYIGLSSVGRYFSGAGNQRVLCGPDVYRGQSYLCNGQGCFGLRI